MSYSEEVEQALVEVEKIYPEHRDEFQLLADHFAPEPLAVELQPYLHDHSSLGQILQHPLVYCVPYSDVLNRQCNTQLRYKAKAADEALRAKNWEQYVWLHERAYRLDALLEIEAIMSPTAFWRLAADVWTDSENIGDLRDEWRRVFASDKPRRWALMTKAERETLRGLGSPIKVYRGIHDAHGEAGLSWTTLPYIAHFFAHRFAREGDKPEVLEGVVDCVNVIASFDARGEREIVVLPEHVAITGRVPARKVRT